MSWKLFWWIAGVGQWEKQQAFLRQPMLLNPIGFFWPNQRRGMLSLIPKVVRKELKRKQRTIYKGV
jgi:hypothetical protein